MPYNHVPERKQSRLAPLVDLIRRHWDKVAAIVGLMILSFFYGLAVARLDLPPHGILKQAELAGTELWSLIQLNSRDEKEPHPHLVEFENPPARIFVHDSLPSYGDVTFVTMYYEDQYGMFLIDRDGRIMHRWKMPESVIERLEESITTRMKGGYYMIHGAHLFGNGSVVFSITNRGLIMIDKDSNLLWHLERPTHHSVFLDDQETLWVGSSRMVTDKSEAFPNITLPYRDEVILRVSMEGEVLEEFPLTEAIFRGNYQALIMSGHQDFPEATEEDVMHLNDVEIIGEGFARENPFAEPGDILVSMRTIDTVALVDRRTKQMKWSLTGPFLRQHDPDAMPDGSLFIFDNRTDRGSFNVIRHLTEPQSFGYSRVLQIDPETQRILWRFEGTEEHPFYTSVMGMQQVLGNGNVLVVETEGGRVFEVHRETGEIVWEFRNIQPGGEDKTRVGRVSDANRYRRTELPFLTAGRRGRAVYGSAARNQ